MKKQILFLIIATFFGTGAFLFSEPSPVGAGLYQCQVLFNRVTNKNECFANPACVPPEGDPCRGTALDLCPQKSYLCDLSGNGNGTPPPTTNGDEDGEGACQKDFFGVLSACQERCVGGNCLNVGKDPRSDLDLYMCECPDSGTTGDGDGGIVGKIDLPEQKDCVNIGLTCIPTDPKLLAGRVLGWGAGLGMLLAILFIIVGGFRVATSAGNPENLENAKKQITAAVAGLVFILLSSLILKAISGIIGIDFSLFGL